MSRPAGLRGGADARINADISVPTTHLAPASAESHSAIAAPRGFYRG